MTSPRTETARRPDETEEKPGRLSLSPVQVAAGALAAVSSAVLLSLFGVAGTVIGAALASVVSTVGSALYAASLDRTTERLRRARGQAAGPPAPAADDATRELPAHLDPRRAPAPRRRVRWPRVAAYAAAVFVAAMAVVTGIELVGQQPVSALVGGSEKGSSSTTIGELSTASSGRDVPPPDTGPAPATTDAPRDDAPSTDAPPTDAPPTGTSGDDAADPTTAPSGDTEEPAPSTGSGESDAADPGEEETETTAPAEPSTQAPQDGPVPGAAPTG